MTLETTKRLRDAVGRRISDCGDMEIRVASRTLAALIHDAGDPATARSMFENDGRAQFREVDAPALQALLRLAERAAEVARFDFLAGQYRCGVITWAEFKARTGLEPPEAPSPHHFPNVKVTWPAASRQGPDAAPDAPQPSVNPAPATLDFVSIDPLEE